LVDANQSGVLQLVEHLVLGQVAIRRRPCRLLLGCQEPAVSGPVAVEPDGRRVVRRQRHRRQVDRFGFVPRRGGSGRDPSGHRRDDEEHAE
jgi:hypothetical protein